MWRLHQVVRFLWGFARMLIVNYALSISGIEEVVNAFVAASNNTVTLNGLSLTGQLTGDTQIPVSKQAVFEKALAAGVGTIDLTSLPGVSGTVDGSGLKVQLLILRNKPGNANAITIKAGASNGYDIFGASGEITLAPGQAIILFGDDKSPDVAAGDRTIDLTGSLTQVLQVHVVLG